MEFGPTVPWAGLQCVIVVFPGHSRLPFDILAVACTKMVTILFQAWTWMNNY